MPAHRASSVWRSGSALALRLCRNMHNQPGQARPCSAERPAGGDIARPVNAEIDPADANHHGNQHGYKKHIDPGPRTLEITYDDGGQCQIGDRRHQRMPAGETGGVNRIEMINQIGPRTTVILLERLAQQRTGSHRQHGIKRRTMALGDDEEAGNRSQGQDYQRVAADRGDLERRLLQPGWPQRSRRVGRLPHHQEQHFIQLPDFTFSHLVGNFDEGVDAKRKNTKQHHRHAVGVAILEPADKPFPRCLNNRFFSHSRPPRDFSVGINNPQADVSFHELQHSRPKPYRHVTFSPPRGKVREFIFTRSRPGRQI